MGLNINKQEGDTSFNRRDAQTGTDARIGKDNTADLSFLTYLQDLIVCRYREMPEGSYTTSLFSQGINRLAQKVGEEALETIIEAANGTHEGLIYEASDLIYHLMVLLVYNDLRLEDLIRELEKRHKA